MVLLMLFVFLFNRELCRNMLTKNDQKGNKRDIRSAFDRIEWLNHWCTVFVVFFSIVYSVFFFLSVRTSRINPVTQCAEHGFARSEMITTSIGVQAVQNWELSDERCGKSRSNIPVRVAFVRKNKKPNCHRSTYFLLVKPTNFGCWNWCVAWFLLPSCLAQAGKAETVPCQFSAGNK